MKMALLHMLKDMWPWPHTETFFNSVNDRALWMISGMRALSLNLGLLEALFCSSIFNMSVSFLDLEGLVCLANTFTSSPHWWCCCFVAFSSKRSITRWFYTLLIWFPADSDSLFSLPAGSSFTFWLFQIFPPKRRPRSGTTATDVTFLCYTNFHSTWVLWKNCEYLNKRGKAEKNISENRSLQQLSL